LRRAVLGRQAQPVSLDRYALVQLPAASLWTGAQVHVRDEVDGAVTCFSDGTNWRRITDRAVATAVTPAALSCGGVTDGYLDAVAGPYFVSPGAATATASAALICASALDCEALAFGTLRTPWTEDSDVDTDAAATATAAAASIASVALSAAGSATATLEGVAA